MTLRELAFTVCTALEKSGSTAVLTGGSAATIYAPEAYQSRDLDFVLTFSSTSLAAPLLELGFRQRGWSYAHPNTLLTLDFPPGPLMIGDEVINEWSTFHEEDMVLHVLKASDSVLDRFAGYAHWRDRSSLVAAAQVAVAIEHQLDWDRISHWCKNEGVLLALQDLKREVQRIQASG